MLYMIDNEWRISTLKVHYREGKEAIEKYVREEGKIWWEEFASKWDYVVISKFEGFVLTSEQLNRFNKALDLNLSEGFSEMLSAYVSEGIFPDDSEHPLRNIQIEDNNLILTSENADLLLKTTIMEMEQETLREENADMILRLTILEMGGVN